MPTEEGSLQQGDAVEDGGNDCGYWQLLVGDQWRCFCRRMETAVSGDLCEMLIPVKEGTQMVKLVRGAEVTIAAGGLNVKRNGVRC